MLESFVCYGIYWIKIYILCVNRDSDLKKTDSDKFLDEIYFFLIDNNMDSVLHERDRVSRK